MKYTKEEILILLSWQDIAKHYCEEFAENITFEDRKLIGKLNENLIQLRKKPKNEEQQFRAYLQSLKTD